MTDPKTARNKHVLVYDQWFICTTAQSQKLLTAVEIEPDMSLVNLRQLKWSYLFDLDSVLLQMWESVRQTGGQWTLKRTVDG